MRIWNTSWLCCGVFTLALMIPAVGVGQASTQESPNANAVLQQKLKKLQTQLRDRIRLAQARESEIEEGVAGMTFADPSEGNRVLQAVEQRSKRRKAEISKMLADLALVDKQLQAETPNQVPEIGTVSENPEVNEILAIRESLGGSVVGSILSDPELLAKPGQGEGLRADFEAELARLAAQQGASSAELQQRPSLVSPQRPIASSASQRSANRRPAPRVALPGLRVKAGKPTAEKVRAMRRVSKELERLAWDLEEIEAYPEADRLRQQANNLRDQSRLLNRD